MSEIITQYTDNWYGKVLKFLNLARHEGSANTFRSDKLDLKNLDSKSSLWLSVVDDEVVSISYAERSLITGTPESIRKCRYHILKDYRHGMFGFKMMKKQIEWARQKGFKHYYWTHDVKDTAINQLFQHKKTYGLGNKNNQWFKDPDFVKLKLENDMLFHDSPQSYMFQFVYSYYIDPEYVWNPTKCVIKHSHQGTINDVSKVLG